MTNLLPFGIELIDGLLMFGLIVVAVAAFVISRRASDTLFDDTLAKH